MTQMTIFHNVAQDEAGSPINFDGYAAGAPLVRVFEYDHPRAESVEQIAEHAYYLFNVDPCHMQPDDYEIASRYRDRDLRSLSFPESDRVTSLCVVFRRAALWAEWAGRRFLRGLMLVLRVC